LNTNTCIWLLDGTICYFKFSYLTVIHLFHTNIIRVLYEVYVSTNQDRIRVYVTYTYTKKISYEQILHQKLSNSKNRRKNKNNMNVHYCI
jgi:hypothetical protein